MKKTCKFLSVLLAVVMCLTAAPLCNVALFESTADAVGWRVGDVIQFGSYPQSEVTDPELLSKLNSISVSLTAYDYYIEGKRVDFMKYGDVIFNGVKYRVVYFNEYRPYWNKNPSTYTEQINNGYNTDTYYWFKYEPLNWQIIDDSGLVISLNIIDSTYFNITDSFSSWESSYIRGWLNNQFYNIAFSNDEKNHIKNSVVSSVDLGTTTLTDDKVYLLSYDEAISSGFGFNSDYSAVDENRKKTGTDYALCQGLWQSNKYGDWWLRTPKNETRLYIVNYDGTLIKYNNITAASINSLGIVPVMKIDLDNALHEHCYEAIVTVPTCTAQGYTTYICACGDSYIGNYTDNLDHEYTSEITIPATHLATGVETFTCDCGDSYTKVIAKLTGHTYSSSVTKQATHLAEGIRTYTCACGDTYTEPVAKLTSHTYEKIVTAPTCTAQGYTTYICACGDSYVSDYTGTKAHSYSYVVTTPATHLSEGVKTHTCSACGDAYNEPIPKIKEHAYVALNVVAPTCETEGYTTYICECGDTYNGDKTAATGHSYNGENCKNCGKSRVDNCSHMCHKSGFLGFIWKIVKFFCKIFGINRICSCGVAHY